MEFEDIQALANADPVVDILNQGNKYSRDKTNRSSCESYETGYSAFANNSGFEGGASNTFPTL